MENNISFTGINGLYLGKKSARRLGSYVKSDGSFGQAFKYYTHISIKCNLTDDANGLDLTAFKTALKKCKGSFQAKEVAKRSADKIDLLIRRSECTDNIEGKISNSNFELNGIAVHPNDRAVLPLFTYLAALTRKLQKLPETSAERIKYFALANKSVAEEAMRFIDNMSV